MFSDGDGDGARVGVRIGDSVLDLARALGDEVFGEPSLNAFMAQGRARWTEVRARITELLSAGQHHGTAEAALRPLSAVRLHLPFDVGDYVDFYANEHHAANAGRIFRPDGEPLTPNWKHLPIGYHGRSGTDRGRPAPRSCARPASAAGRRAGTDVRAIAGGSTSRPRSASWSAPARRRQPVPVGDFAEHVFGVFLLNDWSARDMQAWESQPLGPFLAKSFATSVSPWVVPLDALEARPGHPAAAGPGAAALPGRRRARGAWTSRSRYG